MKHIDEIEIYINELKRYNEKTNIYSKNAYEKLDEHIVDCIQLADLVKENKTILDIGSGSGLPSIILAIILKESKIIAVESKSRKTKFLNHMKKTLKLSNYEVINQNIFEYTMKNKVKVDVITAKAFGAYEKIIEISKRIKYKQIVLPKSKDQCEEIKLKDKKAKIIKIKKQYYAIKTKEK